MAPQSPQRKKWIIIGCGALAAIAILCACLATIIGRTPTETPTPTKAAIATEPPADTPTPQPTEPPADTPIPQPTESPTIPPEPTATSAPTDTPVPTDTPLPQVVGIGQRVERAGIALTINGVRRESELSEFMKADEGNVFLIVDLTIENADRDESTPYNPLYCQVKDADGFEYMVNIFGTDKSLKSGELTKGDIARGEVAFEVPIGASGFIFSYEPLVLFGGYEPIKVRLE